MNDRIKRGRLGEDRAVNFLKRKGYEIIERNYHKRGGEIDIIAKDDETLVFVEVKTASFNSSTDPLLWLDDSQLKRIVDTANIYITDNYEVMPDCRFDLCVIRENRTPDDYEIEHIPDAFRDEYE